MAVWRSTWYCLLVIWDFKMVVLLMALPMLAFSRSWISASGG